MLNETCGGQSSRAYDAAVLRLHQSRLTVIAALALAGAGLFAQQAPAPATPSRATRTAAISGVATDGASGAGVPGVTMTLSVTGLPGAIATMTDSKGRFVFQNLPASPRWSLTASKPGFAGVSAMQRGLPVLGSTSPALKDGEWISDANVVLWRLGGISGRVVDERGEALVGVPVRVLTRIPVAGTVQWAMGPETQTDDRGLYRVAPLPRGSYVVSIPTVMSSVPAGTSLETIAGRLPGQPVAFNPPPAAIGFGSNGSVVVAGKSPLLDPISRTAYPTAYYPNVRALADSAPVELADGEEKRNIDFALRPVSTASISGRVMGPPDALKGLVVRLLPADTAGPGTGEQATALVAADGAFLFPAVPPGQYQLDAATVFGSYRVGSSGPQPIPGLAARESFSTMSWLPGDPMAATLRMRWLDGVRPMFGSRALSVDAVDISGVEIPLELGATISGRVVMEDGAPLPQRMSVRADPATGDPRLVPSEATGVVQPDGTFRIEGLRTGEYFLSAYPPVKQILGNADYTARPIPVTADRDNTGLVLTLSSRTASLSGQVRNATGALARDAAVLIFPANRQRWTHFGRSPTDFKSTGSFGDQGYAIERLRGGEYLVIAVDRNQEDAWQDPRFLAAASALATRVSLDWGAKVNQPLTLQRVVVK